MNPVLSCKAFSVPRPGLVGRAAGFLLLLLTGWLWLAAAVLAAPPISPGTRLPIISVAGAGGGYFLVATEDMEGPVFRHTVVLLIFADEGGALGLVVNRPTPHTLREAVPGLQEGEGVDPLIYDGGPVDPVTLHVLFRSDAPPRESQHVFEDVYYSRSEPLILGMVQAGVPSSTMRLFAGYAGWAPGQLEMELERGGWHLVQADPQALFDDNPEELWRRLVPGAGHWVWRGGAGLARVGSASR
jgi:putative transcriptional regulator